MAAKDRYHHDAVVVVKRKHIPLDGSNSMNPKLAFRSAMLCWVLAMIVLFVVDQVRNYSIVTDLHGFVQLLREKILP